MLWHVFKCSENQDPFDTVGMDCIKRYQAGEELIVVIFTALGRDVVVEVKKDDAEDDAVVWFISWKSKKETIHKKTTLKQFSSSVLEFVLEFVLDCALELTLELTLEFDLEFDLEGNGELDLELGRLSTINAPVLPLEETVDLTFLGPDIMIHSLSRGEKIATDLFTNQWEKFKDTLDDVTLYHLSKNEVWLCSSFAISKSDICGGICTCGKVSSSSN